MRNKRGLSVIIGYALLIGMGLVLAIVVYNYLRAYAPENLVVSCDPGVSIGIEEFICTADGFQIKIKNDGRFNINAYSIRGADSQKEVATQTLLNSFDPPSSPQKLSIYDAIAFNANVNSPLKPGQSVTHKFRRQPLPHTIELMPLRFQEHNGDEKLVVCGNAATKEILSCAPQEIDLELINLESNSENIPGFPNEQKITLDIKIKNNADTQVSKPFKINVKSTNFPGGALDITKTFLGVIDTGETIVVPIETGYTMQEDDSTTADVTVTIDPENVLGEITVGNNVQTYQIPIEIKVQEVSYYDLNLAGKDYLPENMVIVLGAWHYGTPTQITFSNLKICSKEKGCYYEDLTKEPLKTHTTTGGTFTPNGWTTSKFDDNIKFYASDLFFDKTIKEGIVEFEVTGMYQSDDVFYKELHPPLRKSNTDPHVLLGMFDESPFIFEAINKETGEVSTISVSDPDEWLMWRYNPYKLGIWITDYVDDSTSPFLVKLRANIGTSSDDHSDPDTFECYSSPDSFSSGDCYSESMQQGEKLGWSFEQTETYKFQVAWGPGYMFFNIDKKMDEIVSHN